MTGAAPGRGDAADWVARDVTGLRRAYAQERAGYLTDRPRDVTIEPVGVLGVSGLLCHPPTARPGPPIVYFHGGGWCVGAPETHQTLCAWLARITGRPVLAPRYRLAPEDPFPAQKVDAVAAVGAVLSGHVAGLGTPARIALAGDSAGAAVALWAEAGLQPARQRAIERIVAFYGAFGLTDSASLRALGPQTPGLSQREVAALYARLGPKLPVPMMRSFRPGGAPLHLLVAGNDPLRDDSYALAEQAGADGRKVSLTRIDDMAHGDLHRAGRDDTVMDWLKTGAGPLGAATPDGPGKSD